MTGEAVIDEYEAGELSVLYETESPEEVLAWALDRFHPNIAISVGGAAEGMAIVDMAWRIQPDVRVFTLDTGRLPQETHDLIERVRERYGIAMEVQFPDTGHVQGMVKRHRFSRGPETHGSMNVRKPGSIGATDAARVFKGVKMAGQMGAVRTTVQDLRVLRVDSDRNLLLLNGSVPGPSGAVVMLRASADQKKDKR